MTYKDIEEILFAAAPEGGEEQERSTPAPTQEPPTMNTGRMRRQESTPEPQNSTPAPEPQAQTQEGGEAVCPHGGTIGESIDELNECMTCELYDLCNTIAESK